MRLRTARLLLRPFLPQDLEPFTAINSDPQVMRWFPALRGPAETRAAMERNAASLAAERFAPWALELPGDGWIGFCGLSRPAFDASFTPCVEIGWRLARTYWGQGYATEAARAALADGFGRLGLRQVVAFTAVGNHPSRQVMDRCGMVRDLEGDFDHPRIPAGHPLRRHVLYRISACED